MNIRPLIASDLEDVLRLYEDLAGPWPLPQGEEAESRWAEILDHPGTHVFGVTEAHSLMAIASLHILPNMTFSAKPYALIENVVVSSSRRGRGIGRRLMEHLVEFARKNDAYKIMLLTGKTNGAKSFYEACGFTDEEKFGMTIRFAPKRYGNMDKTT